MGSPACAVVRFGGLSHGRMGGSLSPGTTTLSWGWLGLQSLRVGEASDRIGSSLPLWPWPRGRPLRFSLRRPARMIISSGRSSLDLSLPSRASLHRGRRWRGYPLHGCLPCGSFPFGVFLAAGSYSSRGVPALEYVPSQRFARSQGFLPPGACRPCCVPVPPLGFPLQGRFRSQSRASSRTSMPSWGWLAF